jgi:hypothetical protein
MTRCWFAPLPIPLDDQQSVRPHSEKDERLDPSEQVSDKLTTHKTLLLKTDLHPELSLTCGAQAENPWPLLSALIYAIMNRV